MSRDERSAAEREQLAALDRILAGERVADEHLELAALVDSVRANAPRPDPGFEARLERDLARRLARRRRVHPRPPRLAVAGGLLAAVVALTVVISSGALRGGAARAPATHARSGVEATLTPGAALPSAPGALVHRTATLVLAAPAAATQRVATAVAAQTLRGGGVVERSQLTLAGGASGARLTLRIPARGLTRLLSVLAALAHVKALTQDTHDLSAAYRSAVDRRTADRARQRTLTAQLAEATTTAERAPLRAGRIALERAIAAQTRVIATLRGESARATISVSIVAAKPAP